MNNTKWLDIFVDKDNDNYESVTYKKNNGAGSIAIIPYRESSKGQAKNIEILVRQEVIPPWKPIHYYTGYVAITGLIEPGEIPVQSAARELLEETGYEISHLTMAWYGYQSKKDRDLHYIFTVNLQDKEPGEITGDGTKLEAMGYNIWVPLNNNIPTHDLSLMAGVNFLINAFNYD